MERYPFTYDFIEQSEMISFYKQRMASYKTPAEENYYGPCHNNEEPCDGFGIAVFFDNIEPPTPQIKEIDGYKSAEEIADDNCEPDNGADGDENDGNPKN